MTPARKTLVWKFIGLTLFIGVFFGVLHFILPPENTIFLYYAALVSVAGAGGYYSIFRKAIHDADFHGDGKYYFPQLYFGTIFFTSAFFVCTIHYAADIPENTTTFLIFSGVFIVIYGLLVLTSWQMTRTGDQDWKMDEGGDD